MCTFFHQKLTIAFLINQEKGENDHRKYFMVKSPQKNVLRVKNIFKFKKRHYSSTHMHMNQLHPKPLVSSIHVILINPYPAILNNLYFLGLVNKSISGPLDTRLIL